MLVCFTAGIPIERVQGSNTSVYVRNLVQEYGAIFAYDGELNPKYQATGISSAMLSNRLSWFYYLQGSSVSIDTACSSSLVGLHLACQNLLQGESEMVLARPAVMSLLGENHVLILHAESRRRCSTATRTKGHDSSDISSGLSVS